MEALTGGMERPNPQRSERLGMRSGGSPICWASWMHWQISTRSDMDKLKFSSCVPSIRIPSQQSDEGVEVTLVVMYGIHATKVPL